MAKRVFDFVASFSGLCILLPFFLIIAILIKITSEGPVFYRGIRTGRHNKTFRIYKFRTMRPNLEKPGGDTTALNDPRITKIGSFLRKYKLDEFPQLINVLKGEMSIVGPRPELVAYTSQYNQEEKCILSVKPGITDFSSIEFHSLDKCVGAEDVDKIFEETILHKKNQLRMKYVKEKSFFLDMKIIVKTVQVLLNRIR